VFISSTTLLSFFLKEKKKIKALVIAQKSKHSVPSWPVMQLFLHLKKKRLTKN